MSRLKFGVIYRLNIIVYNKQCKVELLHYQRNIILFKIHNIHNTYFSLQLDVYAIFVTIMLNEVNTEITKKQKNWDTPLNQEGIPIY